MQLVHKAHQEERGQNQECQLCISETLVPALLNGKLRLLLPDRFEIGCSRRVNPGIGLSRVVRSGRHRSARSAFSNMSRYLQASPVIRLACTQWVAASERGGRSARCDQSASFSLLNTNFNSPPFMSSSWVT